MALLLPFICGFDPNGRRTEKSGSEEEDDLQLQLRLVFLFSLSIVQLNAYVCL